MTDYETADAYTDLRNQALNWKPDVLPDGAALLAVLMETGYPGAVATLAAVADGAVSLYFSNGGGIIGAAEHAPVRQAASNFLSSAQTFVSRTAKAQTFPLPMEGHVRFYLVTSRGTYTIEALEDDLGHHRHSFSPLFHQGHDLISAIRDHTPH